MIKESNDNEFCSPCYWESQNKRRWPCDRCKDGSYFTPDGKDYPNQKEENDIEPKTPGVKKFGRSLMDYDLDAKTYFTIELEDSDLEGNEE